MKQLNSKQIIDVDLPLLRKLSDDLGKQIKNSGYSPDHILYVERAGLLTGFILASFFGCPISGITSKRSGTSIKSGLKYILRLLPRSITHFLRRLEIKSSVHETNVKRYVSCDNGLPPAGKKILVVDDALDTGHSIAAVMDYLTSKGFARERIKVAVLTTTGDNPATRADFSFFDQVVCAFPWSYDSREYNETQERMALIRQIVNASPEITAHHFRPHKQSAATV